MHNLCRGDHEKTVVFTDFFVLTDVVEIDLYFAVLLIIGTQPSIKYKH